MSAVSAFSAYGANRKKANNNKNKSSTTIKKFGAKRNNAAAGKNASKAGKGKNSTQKGKQNGVRKDINGNTRKNRSYSDSEDSETQSCTDETGSSSYETDSDEECSCDSENCNCEEDTSVTDIYSDEYTVNTSDESQSESSLDDSDDDLAFSLDKLKGKAGNKRKNTETENETIAAKQTKTTNENTANNEATCSKQANKPATSRQSMPAKSTLTNGTAAKSNARRTMDAVPGKQNAPARKTDVIESVVKLEAIPLSANINKSSSIEEGLRVFRWMMNPLAPQDFFDKYWEKNVCLIKRQQPNYYAQLISFAAIDKMLLDNHVEFTKNIDITSYKNGIRETLNPDGRALPPVVWDHYGQGCSIRILNPQTFLHAIFTLNATLQEYFHCMVGANVYLTPPNSQGFAPHYDDIEAFVLQIEGRKRWRLYSPPSEAEVLPRFSSRNFKQSEIGKPMLEHVLLPGDVLYFPRGTIHQACTEPGYHSLHITISVYQKQSYGDLLEILLPKVLQSAIINNSQFRKGLPLDIWRQAGIAFSGNDTRERANLIEHISKLLTKTLQTERLPELLDSAVDEMAKRYQHEALPPNLASSERMRTIFGSKSVLDEKGDCICDYTFDVKTNIRLLRANILRLVRENDNKICIYFHAHNSKEYQQFEPNFIEITPEDASCVEVLLRSYPAYIGVSELPLAKDERKIEFAQALWERGLLMLEKPLK